MKLTNIIVIVVAGITLGVTLSVVKSNTIVQANQLQLVPVEQQLNTLDTNVYTICNNARQEFSAASEKACFEAQYTTNTEFICTDANMSPATHCWVERK